MKHWNQISFKLTFSSRIMLRINHVWGKIIILFKSLNKSSHYLFYLFQITSTDCVTVTILGNIFVTVVIIIAWLTSLVVYCGNGTFQSIMYQTLHLICWIKCILIHYSALKISTRIYIKKFDCWICAAIIGCNYSIWKILLGRVEKQICKYK